MREYTDQEICQIIQDYDRIIQELRYGVEAFVRELVSLDSNDDWLCRLLALQHSGTGSATTHSIPTVDYEDKVDNQLKECQNYTVNELFYSSFAPYFWQAVQLRYPEYTK